MEAQAAFVGADGAIHLYPESAVNVYDALIVYPGYPEHDRALRLDDALEDAGLKVAGIGLQKWPEAANHLFYSLMEFRLMGVALFDSGEKSVNGF